MKKRAGFTLAELLVSMAIFVLIIGAIAALFGTSLKAMVYGKNQERAYAEARNVMNDIKTTLRYADKNTISPTEPSESTTLFTYSGQMNTGNDPSKQIAEEDKQKYAREISWDDGSKRLKIRWKYYYPGKATTTSSSWQGPIYFPENGDKNGAFSTDEYIKVYNEMLKDENRTVSGTPFPIFKGEYEGKDVFNIVLPIKYAFEGGKKVEILRSRVATKDYEETEVDKSLFSGGSLTSKNGGFNAKNKDLIERVLATDPTKSPGVGSTWRSQDLLWRWLNLKDSGSVMGPGHIKVKAAEIKEMFTNRGLTLPTKYTTYYWRPLYVLIDGDEDTGTTDGTYEWTSDIWFVSPFDDAQNNSTTERYAFAVYWNKKLYLPTANANGTATVVQVTSLTPWVYELKSYTTYTAFWKSLAASANGFVYVGKVGF
jgi:type II secretory pathway pseudopilin PulG